MIVPAERQAPEWSKRDDLAARLFHRLEIRLRHRQRADPVKQNLGLHARTTLLGERLRDLAGDRALRVEVLLVGQGLLRVANHGELRGEDVVTIHENAYVVAADDRGAGVRADRGAERGIGDGKFRQVIELRGTW